MKYLSRESIESIAVRVVRAYKKLPDVQDSEFLYVDPRKLVSCLLGLTLDFCHLSLDGRTLGLTSFEEIGVQVFDEEGEEVYILDGKTLLVERDMLKDPSQLGRCNFTIMHEGSHQIFHMLYPENYGGVAKRKVLRYREGKAEIGSGKNWEEWQANALASAMLMPRELIEKGLKYAGLGERIDVLNPIWHRKEYQGFEAICAMLGVSRKALAIRMQQLGYLGKEYLSHPYEMLDIYVEDNEIDIM